MFVDASAMCAILLAEDDADIYVQELARATGATTSAIAVFETVRALMRGAGLEPGEARTEVARFMAAAHITTSDIGPAERELALEALERFGKGRHPARLNMGDCFAYACARTQGARLLFKGEDFSETDIEAA